MPRNVIHPNSTVADGAQLGDDCEIGPFCYVGEHVKLGDRCKLHSHVVLAGHSTIGDDCEFFPFCSIGHKTQDLKYAGEISFVEIGARSVIREYVTVNSATAGGNTTAVGDDCLIQSYCHIAHECNLGNHVIMSSGAMLSGHVEVGDFAVIGGHAGVVQFVRIGTMAMVGGYSKLAQDVLPYCIADGIPAVLRIVNKIGMERNGISPETCKIVSSVFKKLIQSGLSIEVAVDEIAGEYPECIEAKKMIDFALHSERGLARPKAKPSK